MTQQQQLIHKQLVKPFQKDTKDELNEKQNNLTLKQFSKKKTNHKRKIDQVEHEEYPKQLKKKKKIFLTSTSEFR